MTLRENAKKLWGDYVAPILLWLFKNAVLLFSAGMTLYSIYKAFDKDPFIGLVFGLVAPAVFEYSIPYWMTNAKKGLELQVPVAYLAAVIAVMLSIFSTGVGLIMFTSWGEHIRDNAPMGGIMIICVLIGLANVIAGSVVYETLEPQALDSLVLRMIGALRAVMDRVGDVSVILYGIGGMIQRIQKEAPAAGGRFAEASIARVVARSDEEAHRILASIKQLVASPVPATETLHATPSAPMPGAPQPTKPVEPIEKWDVESELKDIKDGVADPNS